jgi:hypothetical protein
MMRDITALLRVYEFFFVSEQGTGCRIDDFKKLKKLYGFGDLVAEIQAVFAFAKQSQDRRELLPARANEGRETGRSRRSHLRGQIQLLLAKDVSAISNC